eukprot:scaffold169010_cov34-Cyclotella_meneghiniana.AAC.3
MRKKEQSLEYMASIIQTHLNVKKASIDTTTITNDDSDESSQQPNEIAAMASTLSKSRFIDLTTHRSFQKLLDHLFHQTPKPTTTEVTPSQIKYAIMAPLLIYGVQIGIKGSMEQQKQARYLNTNSKRQ